MKGTAPLHGCYKPVFRYLHSCVTSFGSFHVGMRLKEPADTDLLMSEASQLFIWDYMSSIIIHTVTYQRTMLLLCSTCL